ncbi:MAG: hypothetical protein SH809_05245 [Rhodothermales bacterium]|nr:hypothetical protein [Rhodothermales bacterium]
MKYISTGWLTRALALASILMMSPLVAFGQDTAYCQRQRNAAESAYYNGDFERAIQLFTPCIEAGAYTGANAASPYTLAARSHYVLGATDEARALIVALFEHAPSYTPDRRLPPPFRAFIDEVKAGMLADGRLTPPAAPIVQTENPPIAPPDTLTMATPEPGPRSSRRRGLLFGGGAAVAAAGVATAVLLSGGGDEPPLEEPDFATPIGRPGGQ